MAQNQNSKTGATNANGQTFLGAVPMKMDSRKFLGALNDGAQAKVAFFESKIAELGKAAGKNWKLAGLKANTLFIEDVDSHDYLHANHRREAGGKIVIEGITPITIVEEQKKTLFESSCQQLIDSIETNDQQGMAAAFNKMSSQRFSGRVVPASGVVVTKDGVSRHINVKTDGSLVDESVKPRLVAAIVESLKDRVVVENGVVSSGTFNDGTQITLPVTKWASLKLVARRMRDAAADAYLSEGFQNRLADVAGHLYNDDLESAVSAVMPLLKEHEEFTLLTRNNVKTLVENALAAKGQFNQQLCNDVATLFYRTNAKLNRGTIVKEWKAIARKAQHPTLVENVQLLESAKNFEPALDRFLELMFEAISDREVTAEALATTLETLKTKTPKLRESHDLASKLDDLIVRLKDKNFDDNAIYEAEDFIATIQEELATGESLNNFDSMPGDGSVGDELGGPSEKGSGQPTIVINSPLINFGSAGGAPDAGAADAPPPDLGPEPKDDLNDEDLGALLGGEGGDDAGGAPPPPSTGMPGPDTSMEGKESEDAITEDPYDYQGGKIAVGSDYGAPVMDAAQLRDVVSAMSRLAEEHGLKGTTLTEHLSDLALAGFKATRLQIPKTKVNRAVTQATKAFCEEWEKPWLKDEKEDGEGDDKGGGESDDSDDSDDDSGSSGKPWESDVAEDQYKWGTRMRRRNPRRSSLGATETKKVRSEGVSEITWTQKKGDVKAGIFEGVRFALDHGISENLDPVILSMDGTIEIAVPEELHESARAAAEVVEGNEMPFINWLKEGLEPLRPSSTEEDELIQEAVATITAGPDGTISVNVDGDVDVSEGGMGEEGLEDDGMGGGDELDAMKPVDAVQAGGPGAGPAPGAGGPETGAMDFEKDGMVEDRDMTAPPKAEYTKLATEKDKRSVKDAPLPKDGDNKLDAIGPDVKEDDGTGTDSPTAS